MRYFPLSPFQKARKKEKCLKLDAAYPFLQEGEGKTCVVLFRRKGKEEEEEGPFCSPDIFSLPLSCVWESARGHTCVFNTLLLSLSALFAEERKKKVSESPPLPPQTKKTRKNWYYHCIVYTVLRRNV